MKRLKWHSKGPALIGFGCAAAALGLCCVRCAAADHYVCQVDDNNLPGRLRFEIAAAVSGDTITLCPTLGAPIQLTQGEIQIAKNLTFIGPNCQLCTPATILGTPTGGRIFNINSGFTVTISDVILSNSFTTGDGGAIKNSGTTTLSNVTISGCSSIGGNGGAIYNDFNAVLNLLYCSFQGNSCIGADGQDSSSGSAPGGTGASAGGGAIYATVGSQVDGSHCLFADCLAKGGNGGAGSGDVSSTSAGGSGGWALGGALSMWGATLHLYNSSFRSNSVTGGNGGPGGSQVSVAPTDGGIGGDAGVGQGGALVIGYSVGNGLRMENSTFALNLSRGGNGGQGGNTSGGAPGKGGNGGNAYAGAVESSVGCPSAICAGFSSCTLSANYVVPGSEGFGGTNVFAGIVAASGATGVGQGGGWHGGSVPIRNTIIAGNDFVGGGPGGIPDVAVNVSGNSFGHNLIGKNDGSAGWVGSDLQGTIAAPLDPKLGLLQDNGGATPTMALIPCSPAMDNGDDTVGLATDQRDMPRPSGPHVDIGAYELQGATPLCLYVTAPCQGVVIKNPDLASYPLNSVVTLTAVPAIGWTFSGWSGDASGTMNPLVVAITGSKSITANFSPLAQSCFCPPSGLIGWWPAGQNANDLVSSNDGVLMNGATFDAGEAGYAFSFDGVDDAVVIPNSPSFNFGANDSFTFEAWLRIDGLSSSGDDALLHKWMPGIGGYALELVGPTAQRHFEFFICGPVFCVTALTIPITDANFHHLAVTLNRSTSLLSTYLDGSFQHSVSTSGFGNLASTSRLWVGHQTLDASTSAQPFHGLIDELSLYNRALASSEILALHNAGAAGKCLAPVYITDVSKSGNNFDVSWLAQSGLTYRVQYRTDPKSGIWTDVSGDVTATGPTASKTDVLPANAPQRFYRVVMFR